MVRDGIRKSEMEFGRPRLNSEGRDGIETLQVTIMNSNLDNHLGAWDMQLLNPPRRRIPVASWLIEQGELLGEIMYILGQVLGCVCFAVFVVWESLFGERHPHDVARQRLEEEREQAHFEEQRRLYKLRHGNLLERRAAARNAEELADADQYRDASGAVLVVESPLHEGPLLPATYENLVLDLQREQLDLNAAKTDVLYWQRQIGDGNPDASAWLAEAHRKEDELTQRIQHRVREFRKVTQF
jgi:hypothetical protein